ncbi:MAG: hypothetical protein J5879_01775 [Clostridia bacterium]|nr:hypothetical protein [Clostridia bacterium]
MNKLTRMLTAALTASMLLSAASCAGTGTESTSPVTAEPGTSVTDTRPEETEDEQTTEAVPLVRTAKPEVISTVQVAPDRTIVYGTAEPGSVIRCVCNGTEESNLCNDKYFYIEVVTSSPATAVLYATAPGKSESSKRKISITPYDDEKPVWGGRNSRLFYLPTLDFLRGNEADTDSLETLSAYIAGKTITEIQKATGKDTKLIYVIIPDPATAYYDEQKDYINAMLTEDHVSAMQSFAQRINGCHKDVYAIDLLPVMHAHKEERIYFSTDTHYTEFGAYYAYLEIMNVVKKDRPSAKVKTIEDGDYTVEFIDVDGGDLCGIGGMYMREVVPFFIANFEDTGSYYVSKRNDGIRAAGFGPSGWQRDSVLSDSDNPTVYFLGDSYGCYILPFIGANFSKVWTNEGVLWNYALDKNILEQNKPDYVILLICQRNVSPNFMDSGNVITGFSMSVAAFGQ